MKKKESGVMDIQREREAFEAYIKSIYPMGEQLAKDCGKTLCELYSSEWEAWQAAKAVPEGFVLMPKEPTKDTLIEIASVCIGDDFANLDEAKELYKAAIKAQEPAND